MKRPGNGLLNVITKTGKGRRSTKRSIRVGKGISGKHVCEYGNDVGTFVDVYFRDKAGELKECTIKNKRYVIEAHVLPYFQNNQMNKIIPSDIIQWQNAIRAKGYSQTYLRMVQNQLTALFTHASNIYNLNNNPCKKVKKMGKSDADKLNFWTKDDYDCFISGIDR